MIYDALESLEAEQAALGACLMGDPDPVSIALEMLSAEDFNREIHRKIFQCIQAVAKSETVDIFSMSIELKRRGQFEEISGSEYLSTLIEGCPSSANIRKYAGIVLEHAQRRAMVKAAEELKAQAYDIGKPFAQVKSFAEQTVLKVGRERAAGDCAAVKDIVLDVMSDVAQATRTRGQIAGLSTGFYDLDQKTGGFQPAHLVVLAGRPGMGKTAMAMQMLFAVAKTGKACLFFNFEMGKKELVQRLVCTLAQVDSKHIKRGTLQDSEYQRVILAAQEIEQAPLFIQDTPGMTTAEMRARARRIRNQHGPLGLVAADYLQIVKEGDIQRGRSRADAVSEIANELHAMGRENDCTCLALSQLSRKVEEREDKRPMLSDLRDSGGIEQEANGVWFTYRDGYYRNERLRKQGGAEGADDIAEIIIGKQRGGDTGTVKLKWTGQYTRFDNLARSFEQPPHNYHEHGAAPVYANPRWVDQT